jgi:integrase
MASLDKKPRLKLAARGKPYWHEIKAGLSLGYRRRAAGAGSWSVRMADGKGGNSITKFATADDIDASDKTTVLNFDEACNKAREIAGAGPKAVEGSAHMITVFEALTNYEADLIRRKAGKGNATHVRYNMTDKLGRKPVALCVENDFTVWRNGLLTESKLSIGSADRLGRILKAVLNLATKADKRIINSAEWRNSLTKLNDSESVRNVILPGDIERAIIDTAYDIEHRLGLWCHLLSDTGNRESQCQKLEVIDLQGDRVMMPSSKKGKGRKRSQKPLPISAELAANLKQHSVGKPRNAPLLQPFRKLPEEFRKVMKRLGLDTEAARETAGLVDEATPYALRHSSIVRHLMRGTPTRLVASAHDTSVAEIERTYSRYIVSDQTEAMLRGALLPAAAAPANVVKFAANQR